ncbi:MAG TPA: galactokinase family protein, partial [Candidatus Borkfalkia excrementipullorum]|nr:galactokinase family protein [Candidatus Borkfalkia excrementipullorum]
MKPGGGALNSLWHRSAWRRNNMKKVQNIEANKSVLFERVFGEKPAYEISAAGRINLIGEHVDYCGGKVMPASLNLNCR